MPMDLPATVLLAATSFEHAQIASSADVQGWQTWLLTGILAATLIALATEKVHKTVVALASGQ